MDSLGMVYVSEYSGSCVRTISSVGRVSAFAGTCGSSGFSGDSGLATAAKMYQVMAVYVTTGAVTYLADVGNYRVRSISNGIIGTVIGIGTAGSSGDGGPASSASIQPFGVWVNSVGEVFATNHNSNSILKVSLTGIISTIAGLNFVIRLTTCLMAL